MNFHPQKPAKDQADKAIAKLAANPTLYNEQQRSLPEAMQHSLADEVQYLRILAERTPSVMNEIVRDPAHAKAQLLNIASTGLSLRPSDGNQHVYAIAVKGALRITPSVKGLIFLATQMHRVRHIRTRVIYASERANVAIEEGKEPRFAPSNPFNRPPNDKPIGSIAWAVLDDGTVLIETMTPEAVENIERSMEKLIGSKVSPFRRGHEDMWFRKIAIRRLITQQILNNVPLRTAAPDAVSPLQKATDISYREETEREAQLSREDIKALVATAHKENEVVGEDLYIAILQQAQRNAQRFTNSQQEIIHRECAQLVAPPAEEQDAPAPEKEAEQSAPQDAAAPTPKEEDAPAQPLSGINEASAETQTPTNHPLA